MDFPKRKPTRLKNYDYSSNGYYFVTICSHKRKNIFSNIVGQGLAPAETVKSNLNKRGVFDMLEKMNKLFEVVKVIGVTLLILSIAIAAIGYYLNSENVFYTGLILLLFGCPVCFIVLLIILYVIIFLEKRTKK